MSKRITVEIDALYGLEPVFEPGGDAGSEALEQFVEMSCPYCGEIYAVAVDLSAGAQSYVEDCQVCCQPISNTIAMDDGGRFVGLTSERLDR
jgi:Cysteine-rich CPXCG